MSLYTSTVKYFRCAIEKFTPVIEELITKSESEKNSKDLKDLLDVYSEIAEKIDSYNLNLEDPNYYYDGEPHEIDLKISDELLGHFVRLTLRLLNEWKNEKKELEEKNFLTEKREKDAKKLKALIWPLEAFFNASGYVLEKYKNQGPIEFPGEEKKNEGFMKLREEYRGELFPAGLIKKLPEDVAKICSEFNFNHKHQKKYSCLLLLRRLLPLSIVRKFQALDKETEIQVQGEFLETKALLGKTEKYLEGKRIYRDIMNHKPLIDSVQHSYTFIPRIQDIEGVAIQIRLFLEDLFSWSD